MPWRPVAPLAPPPSSPSHDALTQAEGYEFTVISDTGATATVYLAQPRDRPGAKCYVVKRVDKPLRFKAGMDYFVNERIALERLLGLPGICQLAEHNPITRELWFELGPAHKTLLHVVANKGPVEKPVLMRALVAHLLAALASCHAAGMDSTPPGLCHNPLTSVTGIAHCDVKPDNILYQRRTGEILLIDFGFARAATIVRGDSKKEGSPIYVPLEAHIESPEPRDIRLQDSFGLACVLSYAFTGSFPGDSVKTLDQLVALRQKDNGSAWFPDCSLQLSAFSDGQRALMRSLAARDPAQRTQIAVAHSAWPLTF